MDLMFVSEFILGVGNGHVHLGKEVGRIHKRMFALCRFILWKKLNELEMGLKLPKMGAFHRLWLPSKLTWNGLLEKDRSDFDSGAKRLFMFNLISIWFNILSFINWKSANSLLRNPRKYLMLLLSRFTSFATTSVTDTSPASRGRCRSTLWSTSGKAGRAISGTPTTMQTAQPPTQPPTQTGPARRTWWVKRPPLERGGVGTERAYFTPSRQIYVLYFAEIFLPP